MNNTTRKAIVTFIQGAAAFAAGWVVNHWGLNIEWSATIAAMVAAALSVIYNTIRDRLMERSIEIIDIEIDGGV